MGKKLRCAHLIFFCLIALPFSSCKPAAKRGPGTLILPLTANGRQYSFAATDSDDPPDMIWAVKPKNRTLSFTGVKFIHVVSIRDTILSNDNCKGRREGNTIITETTGVIFISDQHIIETFMLCNREHIIIEKFTSE